MKGASEIHAKFEVTARRRHNRFLVEKLFMIYRNDPKREPVNLPSPSFPFLEKPMMYLVGGQIEIHTPIMFSREGRSFLPLGAGLHVSRYRS
jgi:hypothetical protein